MQDHDDDDDYYFQNMYIYYECGIFLFWNSNLKGFQKWGIF